MHIPANIQEHVALAPMTTIRIGGPARYFASATSVAELVDLITWTRRHQFPFFLLGGGSNLVFPDKGFPGLVIRLALTGRESTDLGRGRIRVHARAGENWDDLAAWASVRGWGGIECLSGIPGDVGAAPIQNIGAYGQELAEVLVEVTVLDLASLKKRILTNAECGFSYRISNFKSSSKGRFAVLGILLELQAGAPVSLRYPDLQNRVPPDGSLTQVREAVLAVRRAKSMIADPTDPNAWSCGSFFTNPIISRKDYAVFKERAGGPHPNYPADADQVKLSAAWLIDHAGLHKGYIKGNVGLSKKHCLAIINRGNGTAVEVKALMHEIQERVHTRYGIRLEPEPVVC